MRDDQINSCKTLDTLQDVKHVMNQMKGRHNKKMGDMFESLIENSLAWYKDNNIAIVEKTPEPIKVLGNLDRKGHFKACFKKKAQPDFKGVLKGGQCVVFEAKYTESNKITYGAVTEVQEELLRDYNSLGAFTFVLVSFELERFYRIPWFVWATMKERYKRKYILEDELSRWKIDQKGYRIRVFAELE